MDFRQHTVVGLAGQVRSGEVSAREVVAGALEQIEARNPRINAFVAVDGDAALAAADDLDRRRARGEDPGPLAGIPIGVKDLEDAAGFVTSHGSLVNTTPAPVAEDSVLVSRLKAAGCIVVGKTNTPEMGSKAQTDNRRYGVTRNPWDPERTPGGSSGGSAAAIASGMVPLATGSDGGGSIRIPSSLCGLSGFKPSLGRVPTGGAHAPDWCHLSTRGPMARSIADVVLALDAVIGPDPTDLRSLPMPEPSWLGALDQARPPIKVAWAPTLGYAPVDREVRDICEKALQLLSGMGVQVVEVGGVFAEDPILPWLTLTSVYCARTLAPWRGSAAWADIDAGLAAQAEWGANVSAVDLVQAEDQCHVLNLRLVELFRDVRLLLTPTVAAVTPVCGKDGLINGEPDQNWVRFTYPFNLTRSPAGTVCAGFTAGGLPVGLQLIGPQHGDLVVLRTMAVLEQGLGLDTRAPD
jgi:Asp-tRNA(Asn)/Glu-tRNA(Gln) amidotransferase A subunit family amidase